MINGIQHIAPQEDQSPILKLKIDIDRGVPDQYLDISGFCILDKSFGATPKICLSYGNERAIFYFNDARTERQAKRFGDRSLNAGTCSFQDIRILAQNLPAVITIISEDNTQQATVASFVYDDIDQIYDILVRQVESKTIDLEGLEAKIRALPNEMQTSEEGELLYAVLNVIRHGYEGTAEADLLAIRRLYWRRRRYMKYPKYLKLLNEAIAPREFSSHGVNLKFGDADISPKFWKNLNIFVGFLRKEFGPSFLVSGSLLGLVREGGLLPHDDDLDIAILLPATSPEEAAEQWVEVKNNLARRGMLNEPVMAELNAPFLKPVRVDGIAIDLFPAWVIDGKMYVYPHTYGDLKKSDVFPLKKDKPTKALIPRYPEKILEINYGADWRIPDTSAKLAWAQWDENHKDFLKAKAFENW